MNVGETIGLVVLALIALFVIIALVRAVRIVRRLSDSARRRELRAATRLLDLE